MGVALASNRYGRRIVERFHAPNAPRATSIGVIPRPHRSPPSCRVPVLLGGVAVVPRLLGRLGVYATYIAAALVTLLIAGDVYVLALQPTGGDAAQHLCELRQLLRRLACPARQRRVRRWAGPQEPRGRHPASGAGHA